MSSLKKNLNRVLIGLNAVFVASFFMNWITLVNIPSFISSANKGLLDVVQIIGGVSPIRIMGRMATIRQYLVDYNVKLIANGRMPKGIPAETNISIWIIIIMILLVLTILGMVLIPKKKYTALLPLTSSLMYGGILTQFVLFIRTNNGLSDQTVAKPTGIFVILVLLAIVNIFIAVFLFVDGEFSITTLGEQGVRKGMIGLNVLFILSFFGNWIHLQETPMFIAREGQGVDKVIAIFGDYNLFKLFSTVGEAKNYFASNGLEQMSQLNTQIWIILFGATTLVSLVSLIVMKTKYSLPIALFNAFNGAAFTIGFYLFAHKYNVTRDDVQIATVSPFVLILLLLSIYACISISVALAERNRNNYGYVFIAPFFLTFFTFLIYPNLQTLYFTFTNKTTAVADFELVGFENWSRFVGDAQFRMAFVNTWQIWGLNIIVQLGLALILVFIFYDITWQMKGMSFFRTVFYLPNLITLASVAMLFRILLDWKYGAINQALVGMGVLQTEVPWLLEPGWAQFWVAIIGAWMWFGNSFLFLMAGVQGISRDYFEAAKVDGASRIQMFTGITLPLLRPIMLYVTITSLIGGMQIFEMPQLLTDGIGAPGNSLLTMTLMLYNQYFKYKNMAYASTVAYGLFFVTLFFTLTYYLIVYARRDKGGVN